MKTLTGTLTGLAWSSLQYAYRRDRGTARLQSDFTNEAVCYALLYITFACSVGMIFSSLPLAVIMTVFETGFLMSILILLFMVEAIYIIGRTCFQSLLNSLEEAYDEEGEQKQ